MALAKHKQYPRRKTDRDDGYKTVKGRAKRIRLENPRVGYGDSEDNEQLRRPEAAC